ncbi:hypothetical protein D3C87_1813820 [compost metagenome]
MDVFATALLPVAISLLPLLAIFVKSFATEGQELPPGVVVVCGVNDLETSERFCKYSSKRALSWALVFVLPRTEVALLYI